VTTRFWRTAAIFLSLPAFAAPTSGIIQVTGIHSWTHPEFTRVLFDTTGPFQVYSERAFNPDRIFFDLSHARPLIDGRRYATHAINDALIRRVRVAETGPGTTRIVFDLNVPATFKVIRLDHPDRMVVEIRAMHTEPAPPPPVIVTRNIAPVPAPMPYVPAGSLVASSSFPYPPKVARPRLPGVIAAENAPAIEPWPLTTVNFPDSAFRLSQIKPQIKPQIKLGKTASGLIVRNSSPPPPPVLPKPIPYDATPRASENASRSLTRALGLKINRVVIDAGHGGHDYGTIGPNGVLEKDVVLDVALRLAKMVQSRMGAEVVLTRSDDTFIPLQDRTAMANERKADLFLSIHANSSPAPSVAGTETFLLNFTTSSGALDVAARENAGSEKSVGELKDLIQSITMNDKIAESETFAQSIQNSIYAQAAKSNVAARNRGVKRAPFVVLIGAGMPSVLAEIGFLSNARDEANLGKPEYREKIAEALYKGLAQYAQSLSHFEVTAASKSTGTN
jgi:N-acetylmuramoyl-L-alanine amidase